MEIIDNTLVKSVAGAIFSPDRKKVLLVKRRDVPVWVLPGGGIDTKESSSDAIIREILEETGFTVKVERLVGLYIPINALSKFTHLYECTILQGISKTSSETQDIQFFPPPFKEWIEDAHNKQPFIQKKLLNVNYRTLFWYLITHPVLVLRFILSRFGFAINS
jgi:8-oxo-dGTP diphosphatase